MTHEPRKRSSLDRVVADVFWWIDRKETSEDKFSMLLMLIRGLIIAGAIELLARLDFMSASRIDFNLTKFVGLVVIIGSTTEIIRILELRKRQRQNDTIS